MAQRTQSVTPPSRARRVVFIGLITALGLALGACSDTEADGGAAGKADGADTAPVEDTGGSPDVDLDVIAAPDTGVKPGTDASDPDAGADADAGDATPLLVISAVSPGSGSSAGGDSIGISGAGFTGSVRVFFGESEADGIYVLDSGSLFAQTPPRPPGLVDVRVTDTVSGAEAVLDDAFLYFNPVAVTGIEPAMGDLEGGTPITVTGAGFVPGSKVLIGSRAAISVNVLDDTTIFALTPAGTVGPASVHVTNAQGIGTLKNGFLYTEQPRVDVVEPPVGPLSGGTPVTLSGAGFMGSPLARFGATFAALLEVGAPDHMLVEAPPAALEGPVDLEVETDYGATFVPNGYVYVDPHASDDILYLVAVTPGEGPLSGGTLATVVAHGLTTEDDTTVLFGGKKASIQAVLPIASAMVIKVPAGAAVGPVDVTVENSLGTDTIPSGYEYFQDVVVSDVTPAIGPASGGTKVVITGKGFGPGAAVRIGALPAEAVKVLSATSIEAVSPPGSPGFAKVTVTMADRKGSKKDAFFYQTGGLELFVVEPAFGSMAGGTYVQLAGTGFPADAKVLFDGNEASHVVVKDGTLITAKTPPGQVGTVAVEVKSPQGQAVLPDAFTYFNPESGLGGTWGGGVDGDVNVTVLDAQSGQPVPDAFVILSVDPTSPYQGFTNLQGQVTFSGPDVLGTQQISVSKTAYESSTVVKFNAKNITIFLVPIPPPSPGAPPPGATPPLISGKVFGLAKYVLVPLGSCDSKIGGLGVPTGMCTACAADSCGEGLVCNAVGDQGDRCTMACTTPAECPEGFVCGSSGGKTVCLPSPGKKVARCVSTKPHVFADDMEVLAGTWGPKPEVTEDGGDYEIYGYPGETAVVCTGGYVEYDSQEFVPLTMGVARHIFTEMNGVYPDHDVELKYSMDRNISVRLEDPPMTNGPQFTAVITFLDFGTDGVVEMKHSVPVAFGDDTLIVERQVKTFTDLIYDASFTFYGVAFSNTDDTLPMSATLHRDIASVEDDTILTLGAAGWDIGKSGIKKTIYDVWGTGPDSIFAVGADGFIAHLGGVSWTQQQSPTKAHIRGIHGFGPTDAVAVGDDGTVLRFDGVSWKLAPTTGASDLVDVWGASASEMWAVGFYSMLRWDGATWSPAPPTLGPTSKNWSAIWGSDADNAFAVGAFGAISSWNGQKWTTLSSGTTQTLHAVWGSGPADVWAVGDAGTALRWDGASWTLNKPPTEASLRSVWGTGPSDVYVVGQRGAIFHWDGSVWEDQSLPGFKNQLEVVWGWGAESAIAVGSSELLLGPMIQVPKPVTPTKNGTLSSYHVAFDVAPGVEPHFHQLSIAIPGLMGDTPVWSIVTAGDVTDVELPDFPNIEGTPGLPAGTLKLTIIRGYREGFDIDNFDYYDFNVLDWRSWAIDVVFFNKL